MEEFLAQLLWEKEVLCDNGADAIDVIRLKGIFRSSGNTGGEEEQQEEQWSMLQAVREIFDISPVLSDTAGQKRNRFIFIGRHLSATVLQDRLNRLVD